MTNEEMDNLEIEVRNLTQKRNNMKSAQEKRSTMLKSIAEGSVESTVIRSFESPEFKKTNSDGPYSSEEYRSAWMKQIRGLPLNDAEKRAYSSANESGGAAIPTQTASEIISKMKQLAPMLGEITLLQVPGAVKFAVEGTNNDAAIHTENQAITAAADTLTTVSLSGYEIVKLIQISGAVKAMSIPAFESWIVNMLSESLARQAENLIFNGTGSNQPKGVDKANTWGAENSVTVTKAGSLTAANVQTLIGLLNGGYDQNAKFAMSKRTLFTDFMPLQDNSKHHIVTVEGNKYYIYGYPVLLSDYVKVHEAFLGDFKKVVGNLAEQIGVHSDYDIDTNSYKYSGVATFDSAPAIGEAFVKLVKGAE